MKHIMVKYKVKPDRIRDNVALIEAVFGALAESRPEGLRYSSYQSDDGASFVHVASIDTADESNPLAGLDEFKAFTQDIASRCDEPPVATVLNAIGHYNALD